MTQEHISHPEGLPNCAAGHRARHIHDKRCASAGGGHLVECACRSTSKHADPDAAIAAWRRLNRPARSARAAAAPAATDNVRQFQLGLADRKPKAQRLEGQHGRR
ncbi:hypothetical protein D7U98_19565 [Stenotrophomonas maltophilia]|uniref:hypothetical protein n=1 Tax=Stenotrophomonas maltophilia TaxID=40324 RepID=UPI0002C528A3|nr:hypothetical protein [Stenotrophomonas maltophilia]MBA0397585.1 hypothetical protein [Stenotrophomonas maltophilia]MBH1496202.1 hypothetical protein [Stenotrophomonas maltophilia]MBN4963303.1 hypothetical protein [Stenotrophomonas maltophilia]QGL77168.1 hypothetical protein FEO95_16700 [Stenotrophomonas maltophilia]CCP17663.1 hypothetical protein SMRA8_3360 [Stenotrophomonas maltophilia RA8]